MGLQLGLSHIEGRTWTESVRKYGAEEEVESKRNEVTGEWIRLLNEELYDLYSSLNIFG